MAHYLVQGKYSAASSKGMVAKPQDRSQQAKALYESLGGKVHHFFFALGEWDFVILCEMPDDVSVAAAGMAASSTGGFTGFKTTRLLSASDAQAAMTKAQSVKYVSPAG